MRILLQCTTPYSEDDWHVGRFGLLAGELRKAGDVAARNLEPDATGDDPVLSRLSRADFDEVCSSASTPGARSRSPMSRASTHSCAPAGVCSPRATTRT
jgi:hypothetical protein